MKEIQTSKFKKINADLIEHPPVDGEEDLGTKRDKKKKKIYQLGIEVEDVDIDDIE